MSIKSLPYQAKPRILKKNAAAATVQYSKACSERARKLYQREMHVEATSFKNINMKEFWLWLESTQSISESTKNAYSRSVSRELNTPRPKQKNIIIKRQNLTVDLFEEISGEILSTSEKFDSNESRMSRAIFVVMSITGMNILSILNSKIISNDQETQEYDVYYNLLIEIKEKTHTFSKLKISKLPLRYYIYVNRAFDYINKIYKKNDSEKNKIAQRINYFIQKTLYKYGHTTKSSRKSLVKILKYAETSK